MKVAVIGGTGFVGAYLVDALLAADHAVSVLVRPGSRDKLHRGDECSIVDGSIQSPEAIAAALEGCDAVIYNVGILREFPNRGITYQETQYEGVRRTIDAAKAAGVGRMLLMSANGVKAAGTPYQETKYRGEQVALGSGLDVTVIRPSLIFGDPRGTMEIATQLHRDMVRPPVPAVAFHAGWAPARGQLMMSPVHVTDVADAFVNALDNPATFGQTYVLGGPEEISWTDIIRRVAEASGKRKIVLPMPIAFMKFGAMLFDWLPFFPVTRDQLTMLEEGNTADPDDVAALNQRDPKPFTTDTLAYLR